MIGIVISIVGTVAALAYWIVAASYLYCRLTGKLALFVYPWDQWLEIASDWSVSNGWTKGFVAVSALGASAPFILAVLIWHRRRGKHLTPSPGGCSCRVKTPQRRRLKIPQFA